MRIQSSVIECSRFVALVLASSLPTGGNGEPWERRTPPESGESEGMDGGGVRGSEGVKRWGVGGEAGQ